MKQDTMKRILFLLFLCVAVHSLSAQRGIGTNSPDPSAALDLTSTTQGFLPPRMTYAQMTAIVSPTAGLTVYCTDCEPVGFHYYDGSFFLHTQTGATSGALSTLDDTSVTFTGSSTLGVGITYSSADGLTASIPYTGWGGNTHNPIAFNSTNVWGLKATLDPTSLTAGAGNATFNITGTATAGGTPPALFNINLGGKSATFSKTFGVFPFGTPEIIINSQSTTGGGFEAYNSSNIAIYNATFGNNGPLFNGVAESGGSSFFVFRSAAGVDWGMGYSFANSYYITQIRILIRPDCCAQRSAGGEFRVYRNGALVATSPIITVTGSGTGVYTSIFAPNVIGDEVRYILPNGVDTGLDDILNFTELEISGQQFR